MEERTMFEWADYLKDLRDEKAELEARLKATNAQIAEAEVNLYEIMEASGTQNFTRNGTMFIFMPKHRYSAMEGRKEELFAALRSEGYGGMITETVNANTLQSFVKEQVEQNNNEMPDWLHDLIRAYPQKNVGVRKAAR